MNLTPDSSRVAVYHNEIHYLSKYLGDRHLDISNYIPWFLRWGGAYILDKIDITEEELEEAQEEGSDKLYEMSDRINAAMSEREKEDFAAFIGHNYPMDAPAWAHMSLERKRLPRDTWLIHFSDQTGKITEEGFTRGVSDVEQVALTNHIHENSKKYGGYSFAFIAGNRDSQNAARMRKYGKFAVMFQSSGLEVFHYGDQESQVIYWGKAIDPRTIVELGRDGDEWSVIPRFNSSMSRKDREYVYKGKFLDVVNWVENHHFQYRRQIMGK